MSRLTSEHWRGLSRGDRGGWLERSQPGDWMRGNQNQSTMLILGLVAIGVGALAWAYLGPDLRRYAKIQSM